MPTSKQNQKCKYCRSNHAPWQCPMYDKMCRGCRKLKNFPVVCNSTGSRRGIVPEIELAEYSGRQDDTVKINSFSFSSIHSVVIAKLKTRYSQKGSVTQYNIDRKSGGNIMPYHISTILFPRPTKEQLAVTKTELL